MKTTQAGLWVCARPMLWPPLLGVYNSAASLALVSSWFLSWGYGKEKTGEVKFSLPLSSSSFSSPSSSLSSLPHLSLSALGYSGPASLPPWLLLNQTCIQQYMSIYYIPAWICYKTEYNRNNIYNPEIIFISEINGLYDKTLLRGVKEDLNKWKDTLWTY